MAEHKIFFVNQENIIRAGCADFKSAAKVTEKALLAYRSGRALLPDKVAQIFDEETQNRINCLPATLLDEKVCGAKWVSVFPTNAKKGLTNLTAVTILSSTETGYPLAFVEATFCSNLRAASVSAVAAKYLSTPRPKTVGFVGAGQQARFHFLALYARFPSIERCYVASRTEASERGFTDDLRCRCPAVEFIPCASDYEKAVSHADIFVTAISGQAPLVKAGWVKKGALYLHVGGWEDEYEVPLKADKIVCDNWNSVKHRTQTLSRLYKQGRLRDEDIYCDLTELVAGALPGRESEDEFIYFDAVGLSYVDVALANYVYRRCLEKGEGSFLTLSENDFFHDDANVTQNEGGSHCEGGTHCEGGSHCEGGAQNGGGERGEEARRRT